MSWGRPSVDIRRPPVSTMDEDKGVEMGFLLEPEGRDRRKTPDTSPSSFRPGNSIL